MKLGTTRCDLEAWVALSAHSHSDMNNLVHLLETEILRRKKEHLHVEGL